MKNQPKNLRTIKKAHQETGASISYFKQLLREGKLNRYKINSATYISLAEFENLAQVQTPIFGTP
jgi:hypothetical protein